MSSPFNEEKYKALLEGLEISEVLLSEVVASHKDIRISDAFGKDDGIKIATITEVNANTSYENWGRVSFKEYLRFPKNPLYQGDILIGATHHNYWDLGHVSLIFNSPEEEITFNQRIFNIRSKIKPLYLYIVLKTKPVRLQIEILGRGNNQLNLSKYDLDHLQIPTHSIPFQLQIENIVKTAYTKLEKSKRLYTAAEDQLLSELELKNWCPQNYPINIKQLKESFLASGRLDAEYYQSKYEDYSDFIKHYKSGSDSLGNICFVNDKNFNPSDNSEYKYIELSNIGNSGEITGCTTSIGAELPSRARRLVHTNDVIVSSIEGSLQSVALVTDEFDKAICSTGFYVVNSNTINPETLLVLFKSEPMQNLLKQGCSGTILTAIGKTEFQNLVMPKIRKEVQIKIADYVQQSISLRNEAKQLLNEAKMMVEREIEKS